MVTRLLVLLLCVLGTRIAHAAPTPAEKETARSLVRSGREKLKNGDEQAALDDFSAAHSIMNVPTTGREVGRAQLAMGKLIEARDTFLSIVRMPVEPREPKAFRAARKEAKEMADEIAPRVPSVRITIEGDAADGAEVTIDGDSVPSLGVAFKVNPGEHRVAARNGEIEQSVTINIDEGETEDVALRLDTPVTGDGEPADPVPTILVASAFGLAGAAAVVGAITGLMSIDQASETSRRCTLGRCPPETHADLDAAETLGTVSTVSFVIAAAAAVGGGVGFTWILLDGSADDGEDDEVALTLQPGYVGVTWAF